MYNSYLPNVFPHVIIGTPKAVQILVTVLLDLERDDVPNGSSFAVTVDRTTNRPGMWKLWLSNVSKKFLEGINFLDLDTDIELVSASRLRPREEYEY